MYTLPQQVKIVEAMPCATDAAGRTSDWVSLKNYGRAYIQVDITQANAATVAITLLQATAVAGTGSKAHTVTVPIWANEATATTDTLVRQTDGLSFTTSAALANKMIIFQIDPRFLDVANNFDCIAFTTGASNAANITHATFLLTDPKFSQTTPPSAILD